MNLENERYATRMTEVFNNRKVISVIEAGLEFITEVSVPIINEIHKEEEFFAEIILKEEFEKVYHSRVYSGNIHRF